jgi:hypothetical protein
MSLLPDLAHALLVLGPKYQRLLGNVYGPLSFDASLSFAEKIAQWRAQPMTSLQLLTNVLMLSVGVAIAG